MDKPIVYLIPNFLGNESTSSQVFPPYNIEVIQNLIHFLVENEKSARRFIKKVCPDKSQQDLKIEILNKKTPKEIIPEFLKPLKNQQNIGIISEAGMPGIADPGSQFLQLVHSLGFSVEPLIGPSSILLALVSSGLNGQNFCFNGYLPIDSRERKNNLKNLEKLSEQNGSAQIFMETPYRNNQLLKDILSTLKPSTILSISCDLTLPTQLIETCSVDEWRKKKTDLHKRPAIFIIQNSFD